MQKQTAAKHYSSPKENSADSNVKHDYEHVETENATN